MPFMTIWRLFACFLLVSIVVSGCGDNRAPVTHYGTSAGAGSAGAHSVVENDTLWSISERYNLPMRDIAAYNNLNAPFYLEVGQRLRLPPPQNYTVREDDSLYTVSRLFGVNTSEVARLNDMHPPYVLRVGQVLRLPPVAQGRAAVFARSSASSAAAASVSSSSLPGAQSGPPRPGDKPVRVTAAQPAPKFSTRKSPVNAKTPKRASSKFLQPVDGRVVSSYGPKAGGLHNDGINIAAAKGTPVKAAENGVVVYAGNELKGSGNLVLIRHDDRWMTAYAHLDAIKIERGQVVKRGDIIGAVGSTGSVDTPQLHFEVRRGTQAINPKVHMGG